MCININRIQNQLRLLVATEDNVLYVYNLDSNEGGDLTLLRQHRLDEKLEDSPKAQRRQTEPLKVETQQLQMSNQVQIVPT